jgi:hypothetical protein
MPARLCAVQHHPDVIELGDDLNHRPRENRPGGHRRTHDDADKYEYHQCRSCSKRDKLDDEATHGDRATLVRRHRADTAILTDRTSELDVDAGPS